MRDRNNPSVAEGLAEQARPITAADFPMISALTAWETAPNQPIETSTSTAERYRAPAEPDPEAHEAVQRILANRRNKPHLPDNG
ncbi:Uncharacterised protein [Mycobacteroides abscessus subsp. massiliense]|uniref:hypothetical protein n=1 Tax=Mycobacteroides abscessus TaxID=36809 RepID=UPI0009A6E88A|nr:hypothetical protein [Mycobacteroides abscessus]MBE5502449.1 hypothetical protein [Mycobacteroides abscessus]SLH58271.1 Uncharacterised protein [Mycobacteroides abscessus subsp. massiliense]